MRDSFAIGRIFGIQIRVHLLFPLILAFVLVDSLSGSDPSLRVVMFNMTAVFMLFGIVLLHELGHCFAAQAFGIQVLDITFWPLGGMARMAELPEKPRVEGLVAIAGPAVNGILFTVGLGLHLLFGLPNPGEAGLTLLGYFVFINLAMGVFNLIPAFPMDGGRILRAWLARKRDWVRATQVAVSVSRVFAFCMIVAGFRMEMYILPLIGVWVWWMGARELWFVRMKHKARAAYGETRDPVSERDPVSDRDPTTPEVTSEYLRDLESFRGRLRNFAERDDD